MALSVLMLLCLTFRLREPEPEPPGRRYRGRLRLSDRAPPREGLGQALPIRSDRQPGS